MQSTRSSRSTISATASTGVAGLIARPARHPASRICCSAKCTFGVASAWIVIESAPAAANCSIWRSGLLDHQVAVEDAARGVDLFADRLHDHRADRDRRDEVAVHHVDVDHPRARVHHGLDLLAQPRIVGRQDRRLDLLGADQLPGIHGLQHGKSRRQTGFSIEPPQRTHVHLIRVAHAHDRRVLAAGRAVGHQLEARQAVHAPVAPRELRRAQPWLAAARAAAVGSKRDRRTVSGGCPVPDVIHVARSAAMKNPSVPSRCGRVCTKRAVRPSGRTRDDASRNSSIWRSFSGALIVHVEYTSLPPGRTAAAPASRIRRCSERSCSHLLRCLAPAGVGAGLERPEIRARRIDQHAVVAAAVVGPRRVPARPRARSRRRGAPRSRAGPRARRGSCSTATTSPSSPISAARWVVFAPGRGAQVEHPLARLRIDRAGDQHRSPRLRHQRAALERGGVGAGRRGRPARSPPAGPVRRVPPRPAGPARQARRRGSRATCSRAQRSRAARCRSASGPPRRAARAGPTRPAPTHCGCEWRSAASAGEDSPSPSTNPLPSRAVAAQHRVHETVAAAACRLGEVHGLRDRRVVGDAVHEQELVDSEPQRREHGAVDPLRRTVAERLDHVVERRAPLHRSVREAHRERAVAAVELAAGPPRRETRGRRRRPARTRGAPPRRRTGGRRSALD